MTTIAYRDGVMAADRCATQGGVYAFEIQKIWEVDGWLVGFAGQAPTCQSLREAVFGKIGHSPFAGDLCELKVEENSFTGGYVVSPDRIIYRVEVNDKGAASAFQVDADYVACGSGMDFALAAMHLGQSPADAVKTAALFDSGTGGLIDVIGLQEMHEATSEAPGPDSEGGEGESHLEQGGTNEWRAVPENSEGVEPDAPELPEGFTAWVDSGIRFVSTTPVEVQFRSGRFAKHSAGELRNFWDTRGEPTDIVAYRLISATELETDALPQDTDPSTGGEEDGPFETSSSLTAEETASPEPSEATTQPVAGETDPDLSISLTTGEASPFVSPSDGATDTPVQEGPTRFRESNWRDELRAAGRAARAQGKPRWFNPYANGRGGNAEASDLWLEGYDEQAASESANADVKEEA